MSKRWGILLLSIAALVGAGCPPTTFVPPAGEIVFRDEFADELEDGWTFAGMDPSRLTLAERSGFVRIYPQAPDVPAEQASSLLRDIDGDFILTARMDFETIVDLELAGLFVQSGDGRTVAAGILSATGARGTFRGAILRADRGGDIGRVAESTDLESVFLRLERRGDSFIGSFSGDGQTYTLLGTVTNDLPDAVQAGVAVGASELCSRNCDQVIAADFDFFEVAVP